MINKEILSKKKISNFHMIYIFSIYVAIWWIFRVNWNISLSHEALSLKSCLACSNHCKIEKDVLSKKKYNECVKKKRIVDKLWNSSKTSFSRLTSGYSSLLKDEENQNRKRGKKLTEKKITQLLNLSSAVFSDHQQNFFFLFAIYKHWHLSTPKTPMRFLPRLFLHELHHRSLGRTLYIFWKGWKLKTKKCVHVCKGVYKWRKLCM